METLTFQNINTTTLAIISADGQVSVDWNAIEAVARREARDDDMAGWAKIMLAIRDGTYKTIKAKANS